MPYIGNPAVVGDSANTFRLLDDITSFTVTFDATDSSVVSIANNTLTFSNHRFVTGQKVTYNDGGGTAIGGLSDGSYFIIKEDQSTIKLASSASNATDGTAIDLTSGAAGGSHTLNLAFDGVNTKFKATFNNGTKAKISRAAQLSLSINGVLQQPQDTTSPTVGYGIESDSTIVFSTAPESSDVIFGSFIGEVAASFDITDNTVDEFTANGSTTTFTLSKTVPSSNDILVSLDGVTQYPTTQSNTRAYSVLENVLTFTSAPAAGVIIQVRHIGFAGATSQSVTGFYGRTGNVQLKNTDNVAVNNLTVAGNLDVTGDLTYDETVSRNLNVTGVATVASGIVSTGDFKIGTATTLSQDNIFTTGIVTASSFSGDGSGLTGVASTDNIRTNTNATFLQNINVSGTVTATSYAGSGANLTSLPAGQLTGTVADARLTTVSSSKLSGALPALDGSALTGVASTENIRTNTNATFLQNINVSGSTTTGTLSLSNSDVALNQFSVGIGTSTTTGYQAGVSTATGTITFDTTNNQIVVFTSGATAEWKRLRYDFNNGETALTAARSAKELLDNGVTTDGVYFLNMHGAYTQANSKRHYCLMDTSYDGGGWTLLTSHNHGNDFISGTNYHFSHDVGSNPTSVNDFIASNFGYDRRNTFTPASGDEFLVRRSDNNDWRRFVVTSWSPTQNSVANGWETTNKTDGSNTGHPYWANGTVYGTGGSAESTSYAWHFNGCALGGNCANGGDSAAFSDYSEWAWSTGTYKAYGSAHRGNPGANLSWGNSALTEGSSLYIHIFYRKAGTQ